MADEGVGLFSRELDYVGTIESVLGIELSEKYMRYSWDDGILTNDRLRELQKELHAYHQSPVIAPKHIPYAAFLEFKISASQIDYLFRDGIDADAYGVIKEPLVFFEQVFISDPLTAIYAELDYFLESEDEPLHGFDYLRNRVISVLRFLAPLASFLRRNFLLPVAVPISQYRLEDGAYANIASSLYLTEDWETIKAERTPGTGSLTSHPTLDLFYATTRGGYANADMNSAALYEEVRSVLWNEAPRLFAALDRSVPFPREVDGFGKIRADIKNYSDVFSRYRKSRSIFDIKDAYDPSSRLYEYIWRVIGQSAFQEQVLKRMFSQSALLWHDAFDEAGNMHSAVQWPKGERGGDWAVGSAQDIYRAYIETMGSAGQSTKTVWRYGKFSSGFGIDARGLSFEDALAIRNDDDLFRAYRTRAQHVLDYVDENGGKESPEQIARYMADTEREFQSDAETRLGKTNFVKALGDKSKECGWAVVLTGGAIAVSGGGFLATLFGTGGLSASMLLSEAAATAQRRQKLQSYSKHWAMLGKKRNPA